MNTFHHWELEHQGPVARKNGEVIAAEFTKGSKSCPAELAVTRIANGHRERVATFAVAGKREARSLANTLNAKPWNF